MELPNLDSMNRVERCIRHPERLTPKHCYCCGRAICAECVVVVGGDKTTVCSEMCRDRFIERIQEEEAFNRLPDWGTRIWTSAYLVVLLTTLGAIGAVWYFIRKLQTMHQIKMFAIAGGLVGAGIAVDFLYKYYRRKL